jgi:hypothetical protein
MSYELCEASQRDTTFITAGHRPAEDEGKARSDMQPGDEGKPARDTNDVEGDGHIPRGTAVGALKLRTKM